MCGIIGVFNRNLKKIDKKELTSMTNSLSHRGPDGEGIFLDQYIGMGHRRLSIIDLTKLGSQPMLSEDQRYIITYNGAIYNYKILKKKLEVLGYNFRSNSDTEVVLNSWIQWGEKSLLMFNGMFAFGIWDKKNKSLFVARDRYGIKPVYYYNYKKIFIFASEQRAIKKHSSFSSKLDHQGLVEYLTFQNILTNRTLLDNIKVLMPGHFIKVNSNDTKGIEIKKYWDFSFVSQENNFKNLHNCAEALTPILKKAMIRNTISDVEVGSYLSGGIDTGLIVAINSKINKKLKTFTCGFDITNSIEIEKNYNETIQAKKLSDHFLTKYYEKIIDQNDLKNCFSKLIKQIEEPRIGQSYPNYYASQLASNNSKVVMGGIGADEIFAGYPWRYYSAIESKNFNEFINKYYKFWQRILNDEQKRKIFSPIHNIIKDIDTKEIFQGIFLGQNKVINTAEDIINLQLYFESKTFLHGLLTVEDKISMSFGLETRVPFLDNDVVDFAMTMPVKYKIKNFSNFIKKTNNFNMHGKNILRYIANKLIYKKNVYNA